MAIHVGRAYFRGHSRLHRKGTGTWHSPIFRVLSIYVYTLCRRTTKFDVVTYKGRFFYWSATAPALPSLGCSLLFIRTPFVAKLPNLTWAGVYVGVNHASHPMRTEIQPSQILGVLLHLCLQYLLTQNDQIQNGNYY